MGLSWLTAKLPVLLRSEAGILNARQEKLVNHKSFNWVRVEKTLEVSPPDGSSFKTPLIRRSWLRAKLKKTVYHKSYQLVSVEKTLGCNVYLVWLKRSSYNFFSGLNICIFPTYFHAEIAELECDDINSVWHIIWKICFFYSAVTYSIKLILADLEKSENIIQFMVPASTCIICKWRPTK